MTNEKLSPTSDAISAVAIQVGVMIHGWGLHPQSWAWIIGMGVGTQMLVYVFMNVVLKD
jgi:hypothetical protein